MSSVASMASPASSPSKYGHDFRSATKTAGSDTFRLPPTPPMTAGCSRESSVDGDQRSSSTAQKTATYALPPESVPQKVLPEDLKTPDAHVERDPRLIRLTGVHPFNVEPPLSDLYAEGFLNSENLHYVRNHGPVPECRDENLYDWTFTVEGMVENPITLSVRELIEYFEQFTYPITLVCAGNRRKEQNMVRKSKGFSWGPAGVSTALWTGVPIGDLLAKAMPKRGARYVCFEGADKLPNGYYGTSVKLNWCLDPNRGIMVAHKMNGKILHPDHGKPVRIVIPGQIGGRSVKWLKRIILTSQPSDNWYHIYDNRVLPAEITPEASADLPHVWKDERYAIYDLNTNSAICLPAHDEKLSLSGKVHTYKVRGYAYGGGGKRITRMEVSLDKGKNWRLANIDYPEDEYRLAPENETLYGGKLDMWWREACFCWCFWDMEIAISELKEADDIMVRAMDESMMVQPRDMYWSVLGMMNNPWFRVVIHKEGNSLRFEHPTQPALIPGGWMERVKNAGGNLANGFWGEKMSGEVEGDAVQQSAGQEICLTNPKINSTISLEELKAHSENDPWFVINGEVYDGTPYLDEHPGGATSILGVAGQDATEEFLSIHSETAKKMMSQYHIGTLDEKARTALVNGDSNAPDPVDSDLARPVFLQPKSWCKATLVKKTRLSHDTKLFTFKLDHADQLVGLPVGQHLLVRLRDPATRDAIIRAYTPISESASRGKVDVLVKIYKDTPGKQGGKMTQALDAIPTGHFVDFKGPVGKFEYIGRGSCTVGGKPRRVKRFIMVCGGSGITPIFQVLRAVLSDPRDPTHCLVLNGNRSEEDILCRTDLDLMAKSHPKRCRIIHTLSSPLEKWKGRKGRICKDLFASEVGSWSNEQTGNDGRSMVLICGPPAMEKSVKDILLNTGWNEDDMLVF